MKTFLSVLCVLAVTVSTEAFWVMNMSEFASQDPLTKPARTGEICLCLLSQLTAFSENVLVTERVDPVTSPGTISPWVQTGSCRARNRRKAVQ
jgi:hypothetical protein